MTDYFLQITLLSPLTSSAGEGRVGLVDRDVVFDDLGLPILPGRRLKGLWREAYRDLADVWRQCGQSPAPAEQIFGEPGQVPGAGDACIYVANAELKEAAGLKEWLKYMQGPKIRKLHSDDVVQHFATVRTQTAIDRETGSAKENTLRLTRTLKSGWVFRARVRFINPPDEALQNALALGAAALQYMGIGRTRGIGKVHCRLIALNENKQEHDLTEQALQVLNDDSLPTINVSCPNQLCQASKERVAAPPSLKCTTPTHLLRYRLKVTGPVVIPVADGDPNSVITRQDIPGSHLWGAAAWHYLRQPNHTPADEAFCHLFLDGGLRFLTAYPEARAPDKLDELPQRLIPIPHSIRKFKEKETLVDFTEPLDDDQEKDPKKRLSHRYGMICSSFLGTQGVKVERNYHHARAGDRRKGRALENDGNLFTYEAIQADQSFQGIVLGSKDDLEKLQEWLKGVDSIGVGTSRSAQYGEAAFEWIDDVKELGKRVEWDSFMVKQMPIVQIDLEEEDDGWDKDEEENEDGWEEFVEKQTYDSFNLDKQLIITTLSPLLAVNDYGHPEARFPVHELADILDLKACQLTLSHSYTRPEVIGGWHTHLRLPRQQWPAITAGSVFIFNISAVQQHITENHLLQLEHNGLGLRKGEGYGRVAVNRHGDLNLTGLTETPLDNFEEQTVPALPAKMPQELQNLLQGIVRTRCLAEMQQYARDIADQATKENKIPSNALLGRLRLFLRQNSFVESLEKLRDKPAEEQLTNYKIDVREFNMRDLPGQLTLYELFRTAGTKPDSLTGKLVEIEVERLAEDCDEYVRTMIQALAGSESATLCKDFLDYLLTTLRRKSRT